MLFTVLVDNPKADPEKPSVVEIFGDDLAACVADWQIKGALVTIVERPPKKSRALWIIHLYWPKKEMKQGSLI